MVRLVSNSEGKVSIPFVARRPDRSRGRGRAIEACRPLCCTKRCMTSVKFRGTVDREVHRVSFLGAHRTDADSPRYAQAAAPLPPAQLLQASVPTVRQTR